MSVQPCTWSVQSDSNPNNYYDVLRTEDGTYSCDCADHLYRKHECKHIQKVKRNPYAYSRVELPKMQEQKDFQLLTITLSSGYTIKVAVLRGTTIEKIELTD